MHSGLHSDALNGPLVAATNGSVQPLSTASKSTSESSLTTKDGVLVTTVLPWTREYSTLAIFDPLVGYPSLFFSTRLAHSCTRTLPESRISYSRTLKLGANGRFLGRYGTIAAETDNNRRFHLLGGGQLNSDRRCRVCGKSTFSE